MYVCMVVAALRVPQSHEAATLDFSIPSNKFVGYFYSFMAALPKVEVTEGNVTVARQLDNLDW